MVSDRSKKSLKKRLKEIRTILSDLSRIRKSKYLLDQHVHKQLVKGKTKETVVKEFNFNVKVYEKEKFFIKRLLEGKKKSFVKPAYDSGFFKF